MAARVSFTGAAESQAPKVSPTVSHEVKRDPAGLSPVGGASKPAAQAPTSSSKGSSMILPNEFLSTKLVGCRVIVFLTVNALEVEGTLLECGDDDALLLGQAIVFRRPTKDCSVVLREVVDRFPKMAVHGKYVGMISVKKNE